MWWTAGMRNRVQTTLIVSKTSVTYSKGGWATCAFKFEFPNTFSSPFVLQNKPFQQQTWNVRSKGSVTSLMLHVIVGDVGCASTLAARHIKTTSIGISTSVCWMNWADDVSKDLILYSCCPAERYWVQRHLRKAARHQQPNLLANSVRENIWLNLLHTVWMRSMRKSWYILHETTVSEHFASTLWTVSNCKLW